MDEKDIITPEATEGLPDPPGMSDDEAEEMERQRIAAHEAELAPYKAASKQRKESAQVTAEHDDILAELMFEVTMQEMGTDV